MGHPEEVTLQGPPGHGGEEDGEWRLHPRASFWEMQSVSEVDGGDSCEPVSTQCHSVVRRRRVEVVSCVVRVFPRTP